MEQDKVQKEEEFETKKAEMEKVCWFLALFISIVVVCTSKIWVNMSAICKKVGFMSPVWESRLTGAIFRYSKQKSVKGKLNLMPNKKR